MSKVKEDQAENKSHQQKEFENLICSRIDNLRLKLLDLTRRNPLLSTRFSDRSNSLVRVVDEVPGFLLERINSSSMRIIPLPPLEEAPKDEQSKEFLTALTEARLTDSNYLENLDQIDQDKDEAPELLMKIERDLKDRLRDKLNMPARQTKINPSLPQHAKNNGIESSYELPFDSETHEDGRHEDNDIQTLLLPDVLERRLNALFLKEKTWRDETGISVLHVAFGFLEWQEQDNAKTQYSPLILLPVQMDKTRTKEGQEFTISGNEATPESNAILTEKLGLEFNIKLPIYEPGQNIEDYFQEIAKIKPKNISWRVRRWVVVGVFPSARMAMYKDLDPCNWEFAEHPVVSTLFGGSTGGSGALPFGEEYDVDTPEIEAKVPYLISDADSSQFSVMVDIADGKSLAVEGPPGTGKSQTIVNTIAAALAVGKKVLFVAEKSAALEVVRLRLEAYGIGDFVLPLQATRSSKEQVISSIRERIERPHPKVTNQLTDKLADFRATRDKLSKYIAILSSTFKATEFSVFAILGKCIKLRQTIDSLPHSLKSFDQLDLDKIKVLEISKVQDLCNEIEDLWDTVKNHKNTWRNIGIPNIDPFSAEKILNSTIKCSEVFNEQDQMLSELSPFGIHERIDITLLATLVPLLNKLPENIALTDFDKAKHISSHNEIDHINKFLGNCKNWREEENSLKAIIEGDFNPDKISILVQIRDLIVTNNLESLNKDSTNKAIQIYEEEICTIKKIVEFFAKVEKSSDILIKHSLEDILKTFELLQNLSSSAFSLRDEKFDNVETKNFIRSYEKKLVYLRERRNKVKENFRIAALPAFDSISFVYIEISQSNILSFFSKRYRDAKKKYRAISNSKVYSKEKAIEDLYELFEWVEERDKVLNNKNLENVAGIYFDGLDTSFEFSNEIIAFYETIDKSFNGPEYSLLRSFVKHGNLKSTLDLPKLEDTPNDSCKTIGYSESKALLESMERNLEELKNDINKITEFRKNLKSPDEVTRDTIISLPDRLSSHMKECQRLRENKKIKELLDDSFQGEWTEAPCMDKVIQIAVLIFKVGNSLRRPFLYAIENQNITKLKDLISVCIKIEKKSSYELNNLCKLTNTQPINWIKDRSLKDVSKLMLEASLDKEGLIAYSRLYSLKESFKNTGLSSFLESVMSKNINSTSFAKQYEATVFRTLAQDVYKQYGKELTSYNGENLSSLRKKLQQLDIECIKLSRDTLRAKLYKDAKPPNGDGGKPYKVSEYTENELLHHEIKKKTRYIPARDLTQRAGKALLEYKPCWMMSPLAVAQYIPKGSVYFDLVIIDEASQMTPEDSIGALVRAKQAMVVGDTNQLPPSSFFKKLLDDEDLDEDQAVNEESILEMANMCFKPARRLRWHYRSRHSGLIAFSNKHVYDDNLVIFPSAQEDDPEMGVSFVKVNGLYSSGANPEEAKSMVEGILQFMLNHPDKSLGVVVLNQKQRDLLSEEMNYALEQNQWARDYKEHWDGAKDGLESFFIKNLENVQGDERDVIFIGTVYGPEKAGAPVMNRFGPINGIAGKRRLNVLFSRAKQRIVTYSSMTASDIRAEEGGNVGVYMLKCWLEYSATNKLEGGVTEYKEPDSDFEVHVIEQIKSIGCEAIPQVGVKGYSIDIGVKHSDWPHGYLMGVECDGATYHSSKSARDRDRIRQEVLEGLGWNLYRIWSTDWFENPMRETEKLREAIKHRLDYLKSKPVKVKVLAQIAN